MQLSAVRKLPESRLEVEPRRVAEHATACCVPEEQVGMPELESPVSLVVVEILDREVQDLRPQLPWQRPHHLLIEREADEQCGRVDRRELRVHERVDAVELAEGQEANRLRLDDWQVVGCERERAIPRWLLFRKESEVVVRLGEPPRGVCLLY